MNDFQHNGDALPVQRAGRHFPSATARYHQSGVGLIEVLVAVLVLSIAFLGIAALQAMSLSTNNSAMARSMAIIDSYSILDAMRADIASAKGTAYNGTVTASTCSAGTTGSLSSSQLNQWCMQLGNDLGKTANTTGTVSCDSTGNCTITIVFDDSRSKEAGGTSSQTITTTAML